MASSDVVHRQRRSRTRRSSCRRNRRPPRCGLARTPGARLWHGPHRSPARPRRRRHHGGTAHLVGRHRRSARLSRVEPATATDRESGGRDAWLAVVVATVVFLLVVIDVSAVNVAFPSIRDDFDVSEATLGWVISGYNVTLAALLLVAGRYADSFGRKKLFIPGVATFLVGSALSALAPSVGFLIAARVVQGIGGAIISPTAIAVVLPDFPANKRSTIIGITGATGALGAVVGPALGAFLTDVWSWRGIFWINVPIGIVVLIAAPKLLRESKNPAATGKIDLVGVPIGTAGIGLVMFAIVRSEEWGVFDARVLALATAGGVLVWLLVRRSRAHDEPLLELDLFALRSFASTNAGLFLYSMAFTSGFLINSLLLQELWDQSLAVVGTSLVLAPLVATFVSPIAGRFADRVGHRWILTIGSIVNGAVYLSYILVLDASPAVWTLFVPISLFAGAGIGATIATWSSAGLSDVDPGQFGTANATVRTTQQVGYALGISVTVAILADVSNSANITDFRWAWLFVGGSYLASAAMIAATFPSGSSTDRAEAT